MIYTIKITLSNVKKKEEEKEKQEKDKWEG